PFTACEYLRKSKLDASSFFNNRNGVAKGPFRRNTFGGNLAAAIWKKKRVFGFFGSDFLREAAPSTRISTMPTGLERSGDFSRTLNGNGTSVVLYDPTTTR